MLYNSNTSRLHARYFASEPVVCISFLPLNLYILSPLRNTFFTKSYGCIPHLIVGRVGNLTAFTNMTCPPVFKHIGDSALDLQACARRTCPSLTNSKFRDCALPVYVILLTSQTVPACEEQLDFVAFFPSCLKKSCLSWIPYRKRS